MQKFKFSNVQNQGKNNFIILMDDSFDTKTLEEKQKITQALQQSSISTGFKGRVVPVWKTATGELSYFAPPYLSAFMSQVRLDHVIEQAEGEIQCELPTE